MHWSGVVFKAFNFTHSWGNSTLSHKESVCVCVCEKPRRASILFYKWTQLLVRKNFKLRVCLCLCTADRKCRWRQSVHYPHQLTRIVQQKIKGRPLTFSFIRAQRRVLVWWDCWTLYHDPETLTTADVVEKWWWCWSSGPRTLLCDSMLHYIETCVCALVLQRLLKFIVPSQEFWHTQSLKVLTAVVTPLVAIVLCC